MENRKAIVVGISGASSSGKTTLSRLIRDIFPNTFVLHEDDFYKPEEELPTKHGLLDWDCAEALSIPDIVNNLDYIQQNGAFAPNFDSKEDRNDIGPCPIPDSTISSLKSKVSTWAESHKILERLRLCVFDGFLLYTHSLASVQPHMDIKFFLQVSYKAAKTRREARSGYATIEGFWQDPPGYVDHIVWPNYVNDHAWMFEHGDVEGKVKDEVRDATGQWGIEWFGADKEGSAVDVDLTLMLEWVVERLMARLEDVDGSFSQIGA